ncbi:hypothetical protein LTR08_001702 [Meristemomyces frigidus]|nr:hypothetical protein LTR08_001702 [Meristemomyces frigidus]
MTLIEALLDLQIPNSIKISPNSRNVVYSTNFSFEHKTGEHAVSTLWLAETGKAKSAGKLTPGEHNDRDPKWSPDGQSIAFLSDRAKAGESCAIYMLPLGGGEASALTTAENERTIAKFEFAPDGKTIAFLSADEKSEEKKVKEKAKDDAKVWGEDWAFDRLRLIDVATKTVTTLVSKDAHITDFAWDQSGTKLAFCEVRTPWIESPYQYGTTFSILDVETRAVTKLCHFASGIKNLTWANATLYFLGPAAEFSTNSSQMVFSIDPSASTPTYIKHAHGTTDCAWSLSAAGSDVAVHVQNGMSDEIRVLGGHTLYARKRTLVAWHAAFTTDSDEVVLALAQGTTNSPVEVYTTTASGGALVQLSSHGAELSAQHPAFGTCRFLPCPSMDNAVTLQPHFIHPPTAATDALGKPTQPQPTAVLIHGGPYHRHTETFDALYYYWAPLLLAAGYSLLIADYRGSSGRGEAFAAYARGVGKHDYDDIIACTNHAVSEGYADASRLVVGGWSQGGFLSYLCTVRNGTHGLGWQWQGAIPGAGVSDGDTMILTSDLGCFQAALAAGGKPWTLRKDDVRNRLGSAIWEVADALESKVPIPPMLILHGEKDERVPLEQAVGMRRAMEDSGVQGMEYVVYPREGHMIKERKHLVDMGERVVRFVQKHISSSNNSE